MTTGSGTSLRAGASSCTPRRLFISHIEFSEPIGTVHLVSDGQNLVALDFGSPEARLRRLLEMRFGSALTIEESDTDCGSGARVSAYFDGDLRALDAVPIDAGGSAFQRLVWSHVRKIPLGETRTYGAIAAQIDRPGAARAVGLTNSLNPISLVVPCHRLVGASGALTGYGGGLERKRWLLAFEAGMRGAG